MSDKNKYEDTHGIGEICCQSEAKTEIKNEPVELPSTGVSPRTPNPHRFLGVCIVIAGLIVGTSVVFAMSPKSRIAGYFAGRASAKLEKKVLPNEVTLPVKWNDIGKQLVLSGVIDMKKMEELYEERGGLDEATKKLLTEDGNSSLVMTKENANVLLNLLWAFGLANKNEILEKGPMMDSQYGGASNFASTGGWTLASGNSMNHYSRHQMVPLTAEQQSLVEKVSKNIYRPCCDNSTYFPDCNHGMAMLGLLELMSVQGVSEGDMYKTALIVNSYWFPDTYLTIAKYLDSKGISWEKADAKELLGANFSSASGFQQIKKQVVPIESNSGGGCGI